MGIWCHWKCAEVRVQTGFLGRTILPPWDGSTEAARNFRFIRGMPCQTQLSRVLTSHTVRQAPGKSCPLERLQLFAELDCGLRHQGEPLANGPVGGLCNSGGRAGGRKNPTEAKLGR